VGDIVRVKPGGRIPVDGIVTEGQSELDRSLMTGESLPVYAGPGMAVSAGEVNLTGPLMVEVRAAGRDTSLHRIADLVAVAESGRQLQLARGPGGEALRAGGAYPRRARGGGLVDLHAGPAHLAQHRGGGPDHHLPLRAGPCGAGGDDGGLGAAVPQGAPDQGRHGAGTAGEADTVVFDKTGTLTTGAPEPVGLDDHPEEAMRVALALAEASSHPLAEALSRPPCARGLRPARVEGVISRGAGLRRGRAWRGQSVRLGRAAWVGAEAPDVTATFLKIGDDAPRDPLHRHAARGRGGDGGGAEGDRAARDPDVGRHARRGGGLRHAHRHRGGHRRGPAAGEGGAGGGPRRHGARC
jgi:Cu2+-exporting ATPase